MIQCAVDGQIGAERQRAGRFVDRQVFGFGTAVACRDRLVARSVGNDHRRAAVAVIAVGDVACNRDLAAVQRAGVGEREVAVDVQCSDDHARSRDRAVQDHIVERRRT